MQLLRTVKRLLANPTIKRWLVAIILLLTVLAFVSFFRDHPQYFRSLRQTDPWVVVAVVGLYALMIGLLAAIYAVQLSLCGYRLATKENFLLTAYSTLANFFGPLQSGPGVRAVYLKSKHQVRLRDYTFVSLLYYGLFAFFSAFFLLAAARPWWQTLLGSLAVFGLSIGVIRLFRQRDKSPTESKLDLRRSWVAQLAILTFIQVLLTGIIYYVELRGIHAAVSPGQAMSYAGAANFALFVSLTPGAIGFRESFLYFSNHIHHVSTANILAASLVDRGAYVLFLGILFIIVVASHAKRRLLR